MPRVTTTAVYIVTSAALLAACSSSTPTPSTTPTTAPSAAATATTVAARLPACTGPVADNRVFAFDEVHVPPAYRDGPAVRYPAALRQAGVSGRATLSYIVNGDGAVDSTSVTVVSATNPAFEAPSRTVVAATRFWPGCRDGTPVRTRVTQAIMFDAKRDGTGAP
ncbi:MAG: TonB family protein [Gemmatimonadetes bacterium]|nr:TonB family protein [Gemmatimonadota bacterium]MBL0178981.1 TonB family protein [Gemmatimonadota bacterium]